MGQEWFQAVQSVMGLCELLIQSGQFSFSLFQDESVILRVDFEKRVAFLYCLVIWTIDLADLTSYARRTATAIRSRCSSVAPGMPFVDAPDSGYPQPRAG